MSYTGVLNSISVCSLELLEIPLDRALTLEEFSREIFRVSDMVEKTETFFSGVVELFTLICDQNGKEEVTIQDFFSFVAAQPEVTLPREYAKSQGRAKDAHVSDEAFTRNLHFTDAHRHGSCIRKLRPLSRSPQAAQLMTVNEASGSVDFFTASKAALTKVCTLDVGSTQSVSPKIRKEGLELMVSSERTVTSGKTASSDGVVQGAVFAEKGRCLAVLTANKWMALFEVNKQNEQLCEVGRFELRGITSEVKTEDRLTDIYFLESSNLFVVAVDTGALMFWRFAHSSTKSELILVKVVREGQKDIVTDLVEIGDRMFATSSLDRTIMIWDSRSFAVDHVLRDHQASVLQLVHVPEPHNLLISVACTVKPLVWGLSSRFFRGLLKPLDGHRRNLTRIAANHSLFATLDDCGCVRVWKAKDLSCLCILEHRAPASALAFVNDRLLVAGNKVYVYEPSGRTRAFLNVSADTEPCEVLPIIAAGVHQGICFSASHDTVYQHDRSSGTARVVYHEEGITDVVQLDSVVVAVCADKDSLVFMDMRSGILKRQIYGLVGCRISAWAIANGGLLLAGASGKAVFVTHEGVVERSFHIIEGQVPVGIALIRGYVLVSTNSGGIYLYSMQPWRLADSMVLENKEPVERIILEAEGFLTIIDSFGKRYALDLLEQSEKVKLVLRDHVGLTYTKALEFNGTSVIARDGMWGLGNATYVAPSQVVSASAELLEKGKQLATLFPKTEESASASFFVTEKTSSALFNRESDEPRPADEVYAHRSATPVNYVPRHTVEVYPPLYLNSKLPPSMQAREALVVDFSKRRSDFLRRRPEDFGIDLDLQGRKLWGAASNLQAFAQAAAERVKMLAAVKP